MLLLRSIEARSFIPLDGLGYARIRVVVAMSPKEIVPGSDASEFTSSLWVANHEIQLLDDTQWAIVDLEQGRRRAEYVAVEKAGCADKSLTTHASRFRSKQIQDEAVKSKYGHGRRDRVVAGNEADKYVSPLDSPKMQLRPGWRIADMFETFCTISVCDCCDGLFCCSMKPERPKCFDDKCYGRVRDAKAGCRCVSKVNWKIPYVDIWLGPSVRNSGLAGTRVGNCSAFNSKAPLASVPNPDKALKLGRPSSAYPGTPRND